VNRLARLYDRLTPDERLCAFVDALARKDDQELDRLNETCPRKTYVCDDWAYRGRLRDLWILAMSHALDIQRLGQTILVLCAMCMNAETKGDESAHEDLSEKLERLGGRLLAHLKAWRQFCAELGLDGDRALVAFQLDAMGPLGVLLGEEARDLLNLEPDAEEVARRAEELRDFWRHAIRRADSANRLCTS
jgi:hypothetical protein